MKKGTLLLVMAIASISFLSLFARDSIPQPVKQYNYLVNLTEIENQCKDENLYDKICFICFLFFLL
jgi:hypothetical protein